MTSERFEQASSRLTQLAEENSGRLLRKTGSVHNGTMEISEGEEHVITNRFCCVNTRLAIGEAGITLSQSFPDEPNRWSPPKLLDDSHSELLEGWADNIETGEVVYSRII